MSEIMKTPSIRLVLDLLGTTQQTSSPSSNETRLLTLCGISRDRRCLTNMLMVTTSVRMVDRVHCNTTSLGPRVALDSELVLGAGSLQQGLVGSSTSSNDTNHSSGAALDDLLGTRWELDPSLALIRVVANDGHIVARCSSKSTTVSRLLLNVRDDSSFWDRAEGKDVADGQVCVLAGVDELASVHALVGNEGLGVESESIGVTEDNLGQRSTSATLVDDLRDDASHISCTLGIVEGSELGWRFPETRVRGEDTSSTLSLVADDTTHCEIVSWARVG